MDNYPQNLIEQYLKTSNKLKKFDRVFKRFAPNISEVLADFQRLALKFDDAGIHQYAAMCYLGVAKCESSMGDNVSEVQSYLKAARAFQRANGTVEALHLRSNKREYIEGALKSYQLALERSVDDGVMKAAIIREMTQVQPSFDGTSSFASPCHRIYELELQANHSLDQRDFLGALEQLTDIVDNIYERKQQQLYEELLQRTEILRLLLLLHLNLPPSRQSPSHIKLIEFYYNFASAELDSGSLADVPDIPDASLHSSSLGEFITEEMKYVLANIVVAWSENNRQHLLCALREFAGEFTSLNAAQRLVIDCICADLSKNEC